MKSALIAAVVVTAITAVTANAQSLKDAAVVMRAGDWKVLRSADLMTDKANCTGIYKENYGVQLAPDTLFISVSGGLQSVTLRFDDNPPSRLRLATDMEKKVRSIILSGSEFSQLRAAKRLRYQSGTLVSGVESGEIDLTDFAPALDNILQGCPSVGPPPVPAPPTSSDKSAECAPSLIKKMKAQGLKPEQIVAICQ